MIYLTKKFIFILATLKVIYYKLVVIFEFISYFFRSPLTDEVEERHVFAVYVKGEHVDGQGNLFN